MDYYLNNMKEIYFREEAREKLFSGINKLHDAVASTMGPSGKTVIISDIYGQPQVTKDGWSVAKGIQLKDPVENMGATLIKQVAEKTAFEAGDGTTTATVLATAFINNLKKFKSVEINKAFDEIIPEILKQLKTNSRELKREDIKYVANISANNDIQIGNTIQQAFNHSDIVKVEESNSNNDILELVDGMQLNVSYFSKAFITDDRKAECELIEPYVLLVENKLDSLKSFETVLNSIAANGQSLLIITDHVSEQMLKLLETNALSKNLNLCAIKTPGFGQHRKDLIRDLSDFTGAAVISDLSKTHGFNQFGKLKSCKISKTNSILVKHDEIDIKELVDALGDLAKSKDLSSGDKELIMQRYQNLSGKVSIIKVGGGSEVEMKERKDRYDDAVLAAACALEEGIVKGGGIALYDAVQKVPNKHLLTTESADFAVVKSLLAPYETICDNGTCIPVLNNVFDQNIIDPLKVTRCALENAVSVAKTILSTNTVVLNERQWN